MTYLPIFDEKHTSTRDKIINVLATTPGLNTKIISNTLKKQYALNVTYQAIHKTLKQMVEEGILLFTGKSYEINQEWIKQMKLFANKLTTSKNEEEFSQDFDYEELINTKETRKIILKTREEFDKFYFNIRKHLTLNLLKLNLSERIIFRNFWHLYYPLVHPNEEKELLDLVKKVRAKSYTFVIGDTPLDEWASKLYKNTSDTILLGEVIASTNMIFIYGNILMDVYYDYKMIEHFDTIFNSIKSIDSLNLDKAVNSIYAENEQIYITINTDPIIVNTLKKLFLYKLQRDNIFLPPSLGYSKEFDEIYNSALLKETMKHEFGNDPIEVINRNSTSFIIKNRKETGNEINRILILPPKGCTANSTEVLSCHPEVRYATVLFKGVIKQKNNGYFKISDGLKFSYYLTRSAMVDDHSEAKVDYGNDLYKEKLKSSNENFYVVSEDGEGFYHNLINVTDEWLVLVLKKFLSEQKPLKTEKLLSKWDAEEKKLFSQFLEELKQHGDSIFFENTKLIESILNIKLVKLLPVLIDTLSIPETGKHEQCTVFAIILKLAKKDPPKALSILKQSLNDGNGQSYYLNELILKLKKHIDSLN